MTENAEGTLTINKKICTDVQAKYEVQSLVSLNAVFCS